MYSDKNQTEFRSIQTLFRHNLYKIYTKFIQNLDRIQTEFRQNSDTIEHPIIQTNSEKNQTNLEHPFSLMVSNLGSLANTNSLWPAITRQGFSLQCKLRRWLRLCVGRPKATGTNGFMTNTNHLGWCPTCSIPASSMPATPATSSP